MIGKAIATALLAILLIPPATASAGATASDGSGLPTEGGPAAAPASVSGYRLAKALPGGAMRWDPCAGPITVRLAGRTWDTAEGTALRYAMGQIEAATGLDLVAGRDGLPRPMPGRFRSDAQDRAITVVVTKHALSVPMAVGLGTWYSIGSGRWERLAAGLVEIDANTSARVPEWVRSYMFMHELAHVFGLSHVSDRRQVLYPQMPPESTWAGRPGSPLFGAGDLAGLARVGASGGCVPVPPVVTLRRAAVPDDRGRLVVRWRSTLAQTFEYRVSVRGGPAAWVRTNATSVALPPGRARTRFQVRGIASGGRGPVVTGWFGDLTRSAARPVHAGRTAMAPFGEPLEPHRR